VFLYMSFSRFCIVKNLYSLTPQSLESYFVLIKRVIFKQELQFAADTQHIITPGTNVFLWAMSGLPFLESLVQ